MYSLVLVLSLLILAQGINLFPGRTTAAPGWKRLGNHSYFVVPLIATGNVMPYLEGSYGSYTPHSTRKYEVYGSMDGTGVELVGNRYYVYMNHEYHAVHQTTLPGSTDIFQGAMMSLFVFTQEWQIIGGKYLVESQKSGTTGEVINVPFGGLCAATFVPQGFVGGSFFISSEEGDGGYSSWAVSAQTGLAVRMEGLGALHHENTVVASSYLPTRNHPSKKTVFITTDDSDSGEVFLFVGNQTDADPNGFNDGQLYVMRVENFSFEEMTNTSVYQFTWTPVPKEVAIVLGMEGFNQLDAYVNAENRSTNFRKIEDINEDPNNPETFYFAATGGPFPTNKQLNITNSECGARTIPAEAGGCDNPFGKIYRLNISRTDPAGPGTIELILEGSYERGGSYDNLAITRKGEIIILEDPTPTSLSEIFKPQNRYARVWNYNIAARTIEPMFEVDYNTLQPNDPPYTQHMSHSGVIEFGDAEDPMFLCALQGPIVNVQGDTPGLLRVFTGQLAIWTRLDHASVGPGQAPKSFGEIQPTSSVSPSPPPPSVQEESSTNKNLAIALAVGWFMFVLMAVALIAAIIFMRNRIDLH